MWTQIAADDAAGLARHVAIMQQMDHRYAGLRTKDLLDSLTGEQGEVWYYLGDGFEIAMMFRYLRPRDQWHLAHVGFVGDVEPAEVLRINILRGLNFLETHAVSSVVAVRPRTVDSDALREYHDLCLTHPQLSITVLNESDDRVLWDVSLVPIAPQVS